MGAAEKLYKSAAAAVADIPDGASIAFGGFGVPQGWPSSLAIALRNQGTRNKKGHSTAEAAIAELGCLIRGAVIYFLFTVVEGWLTEPFTKRM